MYSRPLNERDPSSSFDLWLGALSLRASHQRTNSLQPATFSNPHLLAATLAITLGITPKVVSEQLGHASAAFTLDTYSHVLPQMQEEAAAKVEGALVRIFASSKSPSTSLPEILNEGCFELKWERWRQITAIQPQHLTTPFRHPRLPS